MQALYVLMIIIGLLLCFGGVYLIKPIIAITSFINGLFLGLSVLLLMTLSYKDTDGGIIVVIVVALLLSAVCLLAEKIFTAISAFINTFIIIALVVIFNSNDMTAGIIIATIVAFILGITSYVYYKYSFVIVTAFTGGLLIGLGVNGLASGNSFSDYISNAILNSSNGFSMVMTIAFFFTIAGSFVQIKGITGIENLKNLREKIQPKSNKNIIDCVNKENWKQYPGILVVSVVAFVFIGAVGIIHNVFYWYRLYYFYCWVEVFIEAIAVACLTYSGLKLNNKGYCLVIQIAYMLSYVINYANAYIGNTFVFVIGLFTMTIIWGVGCFIRNQIKDSAWKSFFAIVTVAVIYTIIIPAVKNCCFSRYTIVSFAVTVIAFFLIDKLYTGGVSSVFFIKNKKKTPNEIFTEKGENIRTILRAGDEVMHKENKGFISTLRGFKENRTVAVAICIIVVLVVGGIIFTMVNSNYNNIPSKETEQQYESYEKFEDDWVFYDSSSRYLNDEEVSCLSKDDMQMAINEIYARHGRIFEKEPYASYFNACEWYEPRYSKEEFDESCFNKYESANINLLVNYISLGSNEKTVFINNVDEAMEYVMDYANRQEINMDGIMFESENERGYVIKGYEDMGTHINTLFRWIVEPDGDIYDEIYGCWEFQN